MAGILANQKGSRRVLRDGHCQETDQGGPMMRNLLSMSVMLARKGKIQAKIGVGIPYTQHGSIHS